MSVIVVGVMVSFRIIDEDDDGLGKSSYRRHPPPSNNQRGVLPNSSHGQYTKQTVTLSGRGSAVPDLLSQEDKKVSGLSQHINFLTVKNNQLKKQLEDREVERDRLREQLDVHRKDKSSHSLSSPAGLPSRVLDGRKVLRDSATLMTPPIPPAAPFSSFPNLHSPKPSPGERGSKTYGSSMDSYQLVSGGSVCSPLSSALKQQNEGLQRDNMELEKRLHGLTDEKRKMETDLEQKKESFLKMQAREQDLSKDIEILRDENSHHTSALKRLQGERGQLKNENESLHDELTSIHNKLDKTETCYKEVEHENLLLEAEIEQLVSDKKQLFEEKQKLQVAVEDALKTKESYRSTIKQLREQNQSLDCLVRQQQTGNVGMNAANRPKKAAPLATPEQENLSEILNLRADKFQLQGKLLSTEQEINSLEAHLKIQDSKDVSDGAVISTSSAISGGDLQEEIDAHFSRFQSHVAMVTEELESAYNDVAFFSSQQYSLVHKNFLLLVEKCRNLLLVVHEDDTSSLSELLHLAEDSLSQLAEDSTVLKQEKGRLQTCLIPSSANKDSLLMGRDALVGKHSLILLNSDQLIAVHDRLKSQLKRTEEQMLSVTPEVDENEHTLTQAQEEIARLFAQKVCLSAQMVIMQEKIEKNLVQLQNEKSLLVAELDQESISHKNSIQALESERNQLVKQLEETPGTEQHTHILESTIASLKRSKDEVQSEKDALNQKHTVAMREFQTLEETEHVRQLNNEKLKMTLTTEIKLLRSKLSKISNKEQSSVGAPQGLTASKEIEQLKKQIISLQTESKQQQHRKGVQELEDGGQSVSLFHVLQNRLTILETENKVLKEKAKKSSTISLSSSLASQSFMDEEMLINLRKKLTDMTRKTFFLESDKRHLTDKVKALSTNLKFLRESKNELTNEHMKKILADNSNLREQIQKLKESLTKKLMAADSKILETVSENDKLRRKLLYVQSALNSDDGHSNNCLLVVLDLLKSASHVLMELKTILSSSNCELDQLESDHKRVEGLQKELQLALSALEPRNASPAPSRLSSSFGGKNMPSVFKSLPVGYLSNCQYRKGSTASSLSLSRTDSKSLTFSSSNPDIIKKISQMCSASLVFGECLKKYKTAMKRRDDGVNSSCERLIVLEAKLQDEARRSKSLKDILSGLHDMDLSGERLGGVIKQQIESLQDQVMVRDSALSDIETQMKTDFEVHHSKFALVKSQVLELREQVSALEDLLRSKDQYIHQTEEKSIAMENELFKVRKELEGLMQSQKLFVRQNVSEKMKFEGVNDIVDVIRLLSKFFNF